MDRRKTSVVGDSVDRRMRRTQLLENQVSVLEPKSHTTPPGVVDFAESETFLRLHERTDASSDRMTFSFPNSVSLSLSEERF